MLSKEGTELIEDKKTGTTEEKTFTEVQPKFGVSTITRIDRKTPWKVGDLDFGHCLEIQANTGERAAASYWVYVSNDPNEKFRYMIGVGGSLFGREGSAREGVREGGTALAAIPTNDIFFTSVYKPTNKMMITGGLDVKNTWPALISQEDLIKNMQKLQVMANLGLKYQVTKSVQASLEGNIGRKDNQLKGAVRA